jgi:hypothetical protein
VEDVTHRVNRIGDVTTSERCEACGAELVWMVRRGGSRMYTEHRGLHDVTRLLLVYTDMMPIQYERDRAVDRVLVDTGCRKESLYGHERCVALTE